VAAVGDWSSWSSSPADNDYVLLLKYARLRLDNARSPGRWTRAAAARDAEQAGLREWVKKNSENDDDDSKATNRTAAQANGKTIIVMMLPATRVRVLRNAI